MPIKMSWHQSKSYKKQKFESITADETNYHIELYCRLLNRFSNVTASAIDDTVEIKLKK